VQYVHVVIIEADFFNDFFINSGTLFSKRRNFRRAVIADAATQKTFDSLPVSRFGESIPTVLVNRRLRGILSIYTLAGQND